MSTYLLKGDIYDFIFLLQLILQPDKGFLFEESEGYV